MSDLARALAEGFGHPLASELLDYAREHNPNVDLSFVESSGRTVLRVETGRGVNYFRRDPSHGWREAFERAGLL